MTEAYMVRFSNEILMHMFDIADGGRLYGCKAIAVHVRLARSMEIGVASELESFSSVTIVVR